MSVVSVYAVFANAEEAERIGRAVVEERLAACINILGAVRSIYRWQGAIESADEVAAIFKTTCASRLADHADRWRCTAMTCHASSAWPIDKILSCLCRLGRRQRRLSASRAWPSPSATGLRRACAAVPRLSVRLSPAIFGLELDLFGRLFAEIGDCQPPPEHLVAADLELRLCSGGRLSRIVSR